MPTPIPNKMRQSVLQALWRMETREKAIASLPFTIPELMKLFIDPAQHDTLLEAYRLCEPTPRRQELFVKCEVPNEYGGGAAYVRFHWQGNDTKDGFYVPTKGASKDFPVTIRDEAPLELANKFLEVSQDLIGILHRYRDIHRALNILNKGTVCPSLAAMRYHWPCIVPILREAHYPDLADSLRDPNVRAGDNARIPPGIRVLLRETNQMVARHQLLVELPTPDAIPIEYDLQK